MKTITPHRMTAFAVSLLLWTASAAVPPAEQLLPNDTLAMLTAPDWAKVRAAGQESPIALLCQDPAMRPFRDKFLTKLQDEVIVPFEREMGMKLADYASLLQGQFTLALTRNGWTGTPDPLPAFLLILDTRDQGELLKKHLADIKQKLTDAGRKLRTDTIRDVEFTTVVFDLGDLSAELDNLSPPGSASGARSKSARGSSGKSGAGSTLELTLGQVQSVLLVGSSTKEIEKVMARLAGSGSGVLAEVPAFETDARTVLRDGIYSGWIHFAPLAEILGKAFSPPAGQGNDEEMAMPLDKVLSTLGLNGLKTLAFNVRQSPEGEFADLCLGVPEEARKGLFALIATPAKDAAPPAFVPNDAVQFSRWRVDGQRAWGAIEAAANEIAPGMLGFFLGQFEQALQDKDPTFDFKKNLIGNLGDDLITYQKAPHGKSIEELSQAPSLTLFASPNPDQLLQSLKSGLEGAMAPLGGSTFKEREFLGRKIHSLAMPELPGGAGGATIDQSLHLTASGGYLALSTDAPMLEEYLRSGETKPKPLSAAPGLAEASEKVGGMATGLFGYQNDAENLRALIEILRNNPNLISQALALSPMASQADAADEALKEWVDFSLLPPFEKIEKYFHITVLAGRMTKAGFQLNTFSPRPPQMAK